jgi:oxygen-independent coproporphyrinogen III oxidase
MNDSLGVYISVPFCKAKCTFCNFASDVFADERLQGYVDRLTSEIRESKTTAARRSADLPHSVDTVYFGGGTPSLLSSHHVTRIFAALRGEFDVADDAEITLECAPGQLDDKSLEEFLRRGMSRVSLGVQSFVDRETAAVGRLHKQETCEAEILRLRSFGIEEINIDLIAGLPHQTETSWRYSVEKTIETGAPHVCVYMLEVDEDSRLGKEILAQGRKYHASYVPNDDSIAAWYEMACEMLETARVQQYEISNFAREGHRSRHNLKYWKRQPYIGFGLDAHSMLRTENGSLRFANTDDLDEYLAVETKDNPFVMLPRADSSSGAEADILGRQESFEESIFLGLRLNEGIHLNGLRESYGGPLVQSVMPSVIEACDAGLLVLHQDTVRLTARGRMASNEVFARLLVSAAA